MRINLYDRYSRAGGKVFARSRSGRKRYFGTTNHRCQKLRIHCPCYNAYYWFYRIVVGLICGYFGGWVDYIIMRIIDFFVTIPSLLFIIVFFVTLVPKYSITSFILIMSLFLWTGTARLVRSKALSESKRDYVSASKTLGTSDFIDYAERSGAEFKFIINCRVNIEFCRQRRHRNGIFIFRLRLAADNAFVRNLVSYANNPAVLQQYWWVWLPASLLILFMMLAINYIGQALRRSVDVKQRLG